MSGRFGELSFQCSINEENGVLNIGWLLGDAHERDQKDGKEWGQIRI